MIVFLSRQKMYRDRLSAVVSSTRAMAVKFGCNSGNRERWPRLLIFSAEDRGNVASKMRIGGIVSGVAKAKTYTLAAIDKSSCQIPDVEQIGLASLPPQDSSSLLCSLN